MDNIILILRHGERKNQSKDNNERLSWSKSERCKINSFDIPLSKNGIQMSFEALNNIIKNYKNEFGYIYSSVYTRCIQTSLQFQKFIQLNYNIKILIRIEYGLVPNFYGDVDSMYSGFTSLIKFQNNKVKIIKPIQYIDEYLFEENIIKRYGKNNFDLTYKSIYTPEQINSESLAKPQEICSNRIDTFIKLYKYLSNDKNKLNLIITHGEIISLFSAWINNIWNPNKGFELCGGLEVKLTKVKLTNKQKFKIIKEIS